MIIDQLFENNKKPLNEVDPRNFDSDEDYYAAVNAPAKSKYRGQQSPGVNPDDEDYFREIFRKKREAAKKAEQDKGVSESEQLDELSWKDIQQGAKKIGKGAQKFSKNVADTGAAIGGAARDVGGAIKQVGKTAIADPVSATYNATKSGLNKAANVAANTYNDVKAGAQKVGQAGATVGTDLGNAAKSVGRGVANVAGGTAGALGATVGGATTGVGRAAAKGFNTGVQNVGGDAVDRLQTNVMVRKPVDIKQDIESKKKEISNLEVELEKSMANNKPAEQPWAVASVNPATGKQWTPSELQARELDQLKQNNVATAKDVIRKSAGADLLAAQGGKLDPEAIAAAQQGLQNNPAAQAPAVTAPGQPYAVSYGKGFNKPAPQKSAVPNYGRQAPGYNYTTGVTPTAQAAAPTANLPIGKIKPGSVDAEILQNLNTPGKATVNPDANKALATNESTQPVAETVRQVKRMMETVTSKADVQRIKDYIDYHMGSNLTESAKIKRNHLISEVTQLAATRRRDIARRLAQ